MGAAPTQLSTGEFIRVVAQQSSSKRIPGIPGNEARVRSVVKVRVVAHTLLEPLGRPCAHVLHADDIALDTVVRVKEQRHIHLPRVSRHVQVVTRVGRVALDPVVAALEPARRLDEAQHVAQDVGRVDAVVGWSSADGEAWCERDRVANPHGAHDG